MFLVRETAVELTPERLLGLRRSLNTPVVSTAEVPTGPARAVLVVHLDVDGSPTITLAVKPIREDHVVFYGIEDDLDGHRALSVGIDAALSFGESLGFLFDDDEVDADEGARLRAYRVWRELCGHGDDPEPETPTEVAEPAELLLEELADEELPEPSDGPVAILLTKFRNRAAAKRGAGPRAALGRVRLVKRAALADPVEEAARLLRLLSAF